MVKNSVKSKGRNPIASSGDGRRNFNCPHYVDCLDQAILKKWNGWRCDKCEYRETQVILQEY